MDKKSSPGEKMLFVRMACDAPWNGTGLDAYRPNNLKLANVLQKIKGWTFGK